MNRTLVNAKHSSKQKIYLVYFRVSIEIYWILNITLFIDNLINFSQSAFRFSLTVTTNKFITNQDNWLEIGINWINLIIVYAYEM